MCENCAHDKEETAPKQKEYMYVTTALLTSIVMLRAMPS